MHVDIPVFAAWERAYGLDVVRVGGNQQRENCRRLKRTRAQGEKKCIFVLDACMQVVRRLNASQEDERLTKRADVKVDATSVALDRLRAADFDREQAAFDLVEASRRNTQLRGELLRIGARAAVRLAAHKLRSEIERGPGDQGVNAAPLSGEAHGPRSTQQNVDWHGAILRSGESAIWYDYPLHNCSKVLGDATREDVLLSADYMKDRAGELAAKHRMLAAIAEELEDGQVVRDCLSVDDIARIARESGVSPK